MKLASSITVLRLFISDPAYMGALALKIVPVIGLFVACTAMSCVIIFPPSPYRKSVAEVPVFRVQIKGKVGFINSAGQIAISPKFYPTVDDAADFSDGLCPVKLKQDLWGYIDANGRVAFEPRFQKAYRFSEGLAVVRLREGRKAGHLAVISHSGSIVFHLPVGVSSVEAFHQGYVQRIA